MDQLFGRRFLWVFGSLVVCGASLLGTIFHQRMVASREYAAESHRAVEEARLMRAGAVVHSGMIVPPGATFSDALAQMEIAPAQAQEIVRSAKRVFDLQQVRAGEEIEVGRSAAGELREVRYKIDGDRMLSVRRHENGFAAEIQTIPSHVAAKSAAGAQPHLQTGSDRQPPPNPASLH